MKGEGTSKGKLLLVIVGFFIILNVGLFGALKLGAWMQRDKADGSEAKQIAVECATGGECAEPHDDD